MGDAKTSVAKNWLLKSKRDLLTAKKLLAGEDKYLDTAIYHCQQAAEKAIKGFLVFHDQRVEKTHDIQILIQKGIPFAPKLASWLDVGEQLTPYATEYRYPGVFFEPDVSEFLDALKVSNDFYEFILSRLPADVSL